MADSQTVVLTSPGTPKSVNAGGSGYRVHWAVARKEKKMWEDFWYVLLLESKLPRHRAYIEASAVLAFPQRRRRDAENFIPSVTKPLADTLVKGLWLPDDTPEFYRFTGLVFEAGPSSTKVTLVAR